MNRKIKILCCLAAAFVAFGFVLEAFNTLSAHSLPLPGALSLPACHSRSLSCEPPTDLNELDPAYIIPDGHCRDGLGTALQCQEDELFPYLDLIAIEGQDNSTTYLLTEKNRVFNEPCQDGMAGPFPCENMDLLAFLPLEDIGGGRGSDIWGWTDPETGREYALMGRNDGTSFVDITIPISPTYLGELPSHTQAAPWRDLKVYKDHAFIVADFNRTHGMQVFDLRQLRDVITSTQPLAVTTSPTTAVLPSSTAFASSVFTPTLFSTTAHFDGFNRAHNIAINEDSGFAYTVGGEKCDSGPYIINIQDPLEPQFVSCYNDGDYAHDAQCVRYRGPDLAYNDREICFNSTVKSLTIVDVTDKENPQMLAKVDSSAYDFEFSYFHQSWLTEDQRYLLSDDELDESKFGHNARTHIWDVSDLQNPTVIGLHTADVVSVDHNLYVRGNYVFEANYTSGLRIFSLDNVANGELREVAYLDTMPEADEFVTGSAWSVYPYFESGAVVVSSIEGGLFVLQPNLPAEFTARAADNVLDICVGASTGLTDSVTHTGVLELSAYNHYSGTVQLAVEPPNPNIMLSRNEAIFAGNGEFVADIEFEINGFSDGIHPFEISLTDSVTTTSLSYEIKLHRAVPDAVSIGGGSATVAAPNIFSWPATPGAVDYLLEVSPAEDFSTVVYAERTRSTTAAFPPHLAGAYFWRVQALNSCGASGFTKAQSMQINDTIYLPVVQ